MIGKEDYFKARDIYLTNKNDLSKFHRAVIEANLDYSFNKPKSSNEKVGIVMKYYNDFNQLADSIQTLLYYIKMDNYVRLYQYSDAENVAEEIEKNYAGFIAKDSAKAVSLKDKLSMFHVLSNTPKQEITIKNNDSIQLIKDAVGLKNLKITQGINSDYFVFDTGAGFSTVPETTAKKYKMHILESLMNVGTATGKSIKAHIAVCDELNIENIEVKNAIFLVVADSALAFPQINYRIQGIIGFPIIEALKEIQIMNDDKLIIPKRQTTWNAPSNLALSNLSLRISINDSAYIFDTGASSTWLSKKYYDANKTTIDAHYKQETFMQGGAGNIDTSKGYLIDFVTTINNKKITVPNVNVLIRETTSDDDDNNTYGRIGQDFIHQFNKTTINFDKMFIKFDN
ncbi:pepsin/retropepsin-like aspartic protease family protein [Arachidicoccus ginsenosidimutans]|uniref:pepsin/retropepsin-like aspartic protease family protein n=1 Tax=Arachidicoccus sp. BS20 TaxID=1850526 RepID=UPI001E4F8ABE|nr:pepsin/retropepsin-like aspartic protease family protein [Arachidicoccus sp. BS20]